MMAFTCFSLRSMISYFISKLLLGIDGAFFGHEVAYMTVRGHDIEVLAKVFADRIRLGGRLHDDEVLGHLSP